MPSTCVLEAFRWEQRGWVKGQGPVGEAVVTLRSAGPGEHCRQSHKGGGEPVKCQLLQQVGQQEQNLAGLPPLPLLFRLDRHTPMAMAGDRH